jgi:transcriptional regulator with XRE-family HTH domain
MTVNAVSHPTSVVGAKIRAVRGDRGLTVRALAEAAGVSAAMVSQVERGISEPSLETLRHLARALQIPVFNLFQSEEWQPIAVIRAARRIRVSPPEGGPTYSRVSPGFGRLEMLEGALQPGDSSSAEPWSHPSEECVLVTSGELRLELDGTVEELELGDSCYFDSRKPHRYVNIGPTLATYIVAITPPSY